MLWKLILCFLIWIYPKKKTQETLTVLISLPYRYSIVSRNSPPNKSVSSEVMTRYNTSDLVTTNYVIEMKAPQINENLVPIIAYRSETHATLTPDWPHWLKAVCLTCVLRGTFVWEFHFYTYLTNLYMYEQSGAHEIG